MITVLRSFCIFCCLSLLTLGSCKDEKSKTQTINDHKAIPLANREISLPQNDTAGIGDDTMLVVDTIVPKNYDEFAFGKLSFGMNPNQVKALNPGRQKLADFYYHFTYRFNRNNELYAIYLHSEASKAIVYETDLQAKYTNLCRVISEKYGNKSRCGSLPSIFDVMNNRTLYLASWKISEKKIQIGIQQEQLDAYKVVCKISHISREKAAQKEKYLKDNKKWIDASKKF